MSAPAINRDQILEAIWQTDQLPPYPGIVAEVERELARPDPSPNKVATILARDPALSASILRLANSAAQASRSETTNVSQAIVRLGLRQTRRVVLTAALVQRWPVHRSVNQRSFWNHSIAVALVAGDLPKFTTISIPAETQEATFTAGILHDLGALMLARTFPEQYSRLCELRLETGQGASSTEFEHWGIDHGEVGGIVACRWRLPDSLRDSVAFHHQPWKSGSEYRLLTQVIHIADFLCNSQGLNRTDEMVPEDFDHASWEALGLQAEEMDNLYNAVTEQGQRSLEWVTALNGGDRGRPSMRSP